jgi:MFS family permease
MEKKKLFGVDIRIFWLGVVSFLTDVSSEMIFSVFSVFVTVVLGASTVILGLMEGLADFSASSLDYVAGFLSDRSGKRKPYTVIGYGFSTLAKGILLVSTTISSVFAFRVVERLGKSFRGPPRDAWIAGITQKENRGYSFGLHKAMDKAGAVLGPFIAYLILSKLGQDLAAFKVLFIVAFVPAVLAVIVLIMMKDTPSSPVKHESFFKAYSTLGKDFKHYLKTAGLFSFAYFSFGFLMLKAYLVGFQIKDVVLLYALFNLSFVLLSSHIGKLGDRIGRKKVIAAEYVLYSLVAVGFIFASQKWQVILLFVLFGIFYAIDEGQSKAYISDMKAKKRGTAIGLYNFTIGLVYLPASLIAGYLWGLNPDYAFGFAAVVSLSALAFFTLKKE